MGNFFEKVKRQGDYIIYKYFMHDYISFQCNHLVIVSQIYLIEIKVKTSKLRRWKMT